VRRFVPGQPVQVTGTWGYVEDGGVPKPVRRAALLLAARWFKRREAPFGSVPVATPDLGTIGKIAAQDVDVQRLLRPYRRGHAWVVTV
jgi:hypothetical protein